MSKCQLNFAFSVKCEVTLFTNRRRRETILYFEQKAKGEIVKWNGNQQFWMIDGAMSLNWNTNEKWKHIAYTLRDGVSVSKSWDISIYLNVYTRTRGIQDLPNHSWQCFTFFLFFFFRRKIGYIVRLSFFFKSCKTMEPHVKKNTEKKNPKIPITATDPNPRRAK